MRSSVALRSVAFLFVMAMFVALSSSVSAQETTADAGALCRQKCVETVAVCLKDAAGNTSTGAAESCKVSMNDCSAKCPASNPNSGSMTPPPPANMIPGQPPVGAMPPGMTVPDMSQFKNMLPPGFDPSQLQNLQGMPDMSQFQGMPRSQGDAMNGFPSGEAGSGGYKGIGSPPGPNMEEMMKKQDEGMQKRSEEMEKKQQEMMKKQEERQKKQMEQGLKQMKTGAKSMERVVAQVKKRVTELKAKNIPVNEDLVAAVASAEATLAKIQAATDVQEGADLVTEVLEQMDMFREEMPRLEQLAQLPNVLKRAEQELTKLKKAVDRTKAALKRAGGDYSDQTKEIDVKIAEIRTAIDNARAGKVADGSDNVIESLQDTAFAMFEDAWQMEGALEAVRQFKQTVTQIDRQVKSNDRIIASLVKRKEDVVEAKAIQVKIKAALAVLKANINSKNIDTIYDKLTDFSDLQQEFEDVVTSTQSDNAGDNVKPSTQNGFGVPQFDAPAGLPGSSKFDEKSIDGLKTIAPFIQ